VALDREYGIIGTQGYDDNHDPIGAAYIYEDFLPPLAPDSENYWEIVIGGDNDDSAKSIQPTQDGGYIVAGGTESFGAGGDIWVIKLDRYGNIIWQKSYGSSSGAKAWSIRETYDQNQIADGYIVGGGLLTCATAACADIWILKLNLDGTIAWQKSYDGGSTDGEAAIQQTADGGYIMVDLTLSFGTGDLDIWVLKLNSNGTIAWQKTYRGGSQEWSCHPDENFQQTLDGGYILVNATSSFGAGGKDIWVLKLTSDGSIDWQMTYGGSEDEEVESIRNTPDGGYIFMGKTESFGLSDESVWVVKLDSEGNVEWQNAYSEWDGYGEYEAESLIVTDDQEYIIGHSAGGGDWAMKLTSIGSIVWSKTFAYNTSIRSISHSLNGGYVAAGKAESYRIADVEDFWITHFDSNGDITGCDSVESKLPVYTATSATVQDTNITPMNTSAATSDTNAQVQDTNAQLTVVCGSPIPGDVNNDRNVTILDTIVAFQALNNITQPNVQLLADVNHDGRIDHAEAIYALQAAAMLR